MMLARQQRISTAQVRSAQRYGAALTRLAVLAIFGLLGAAAPAMAIVISGGPTTTPGSGWGCTAPVAGTEKLPGGGNYTCSGTAGAFTNLYLGVNRLTLREELNTEPRKFIQRLEQVLRTPR